jgi:amino acid permease
MRLADIELGRSAQSSSSSSPQTPRGQHHDGNATSTSKSTPLAAAFNLTNSIIGAGIIGMPLALRHAGFASGILMMLCVAAMSFYTFGRIIHCALVTRSRDYEELAFKALGSFGYYASMAASLFMACVPLAAHALTCSALCCDIICVVVLHA